MENREQPPALTGALEDYLETIYELVRDRKLARVRDIASLRGVRSGSVSPAMKRLADMGLIRYVRREYIDLTPEGLEQAQRVYARHRILTRLFEEVLGLSREDAVENACCMEHSLTRQGMSSLVRFFEFLQVCPEGRRLLDLFQHCGLVRDNPSAECELACEARERARADRLGRLRNLAEMEAGERGRVVQVNATGALRQKILDLGILPNGVVTVVAFQTDEDAFRIRLEGFEIVLGRDEAEAVLVESAD
ncbi:MAG: metal-dependent transcriptional regulator [Candidatus Eisenbacteria bacterium]|nr:metal-dependent transcriptional regulator [Candidatus Eisenbacteria bacterium]